MNERKRAYYTANKAAYLARRKHRWAKLMKGPRRERKRIELWQRFKLTLEEFARIKAEQGNRCGICKRKFGRLAKNRPHVDHCHETEHVRGLLCLNCNTKMGWFEYVGYTAIREYME